MSKLLTYILDHEENFRRARLPSLYSDFRVQRTTNPDGYAANIAAWQIALANAAQAGMISSAGGGDADLLSFTVGEDLVRALQTRELGRPLALGTVIDDGISKKQWIIFDDFLRSKTSIYEGRWRISPWALLSWGLIQLGLTDDSSVDEQLRRGRFVVLRNVEEAGRKIKTQISQRRNRVDRVYTLDMFKREAARIMDLPADITKADLDVLLIYLARDERATVKFKAAGETAIGLTPEDTTIASLKTLIADLSEQTKILTSKVNDFSSSARSAVLNRNRVSALAALRSKKLAEKTLNQRHETLLQLEEIYSSIEQAADQVEIVRIMEASTGVLKGLHTEAGGLEKVEDVVQGLQDEMSTVNEIGAVLNEAGERNNLVNDSEVDDELEALEREERGKREQDQAEETRRQLEDIEMATNEREKSKQPSLQDETRESQAAKSSVDSSLEQSIGAFDRMSIDADDNAGKGKEGAPKQSDHLAVPERS